MYVYLLKNISSLDDIEEPLDVITSKYSSSNRVESLCWQRKGKLGPHLYTPYKDNDKSNVSEQYNTLMKNGIS